MALLALFLLGNLVLFAAYRLAFLAFFVPRTSPGPTWAALRYGARLDLALLGAEVSLLACWCLVTRAVRARSVFRLAYGLTCLHLLFCVADLSFYGQRNQHMGELLIANLVEPGVVWDEVRTFLSSRVLTALAALAAAVLTGWLGLRLLRRVPSAAWRLGPSPHRVLAVLLVGGLAWTPLLQVVTQKRRAVGGRELPGWSVQLATSRHYARLDDYLLHQAIPNPLHELCIVHLPWLSLDAPARRLDPEDALAVCLRMRREFFAQCETSQRLSNRCTVYPVRR